MAQPQDTSSVSSQPGSDRLQALRGKLDQCIDEIVTARPDRAAAVKKEFDAAWKELNELKPEGVTTH